MFQRIGGRLSVLACIPLLFLLIPLFGQIDKTHEEALERLKSADVHFSRGLKEFNARRSEKASAAFQDCLRLMPQHAYAHYYLANLYYVQEDYQNSLTHMEQALSQFDFMQELSDYADKQNRQTIDSYQQMLGMEWENTGDCRTRRRIEDVTGQLADGKGAIELLAKKRQLKRAQQKAHYLYFLGNVLFQLKRFPEALRSYQKAIALNPEHASAYNNAAAIYYLAGQYPAALTYLDKAEQQGLEDNLNLKLKQLLYEALGRPTEGILREDLSPGAASDLGVIRFALAFKPEDDRLPPLYENCYVAFCRTSRQAIIIDPGAQDPRIDEFIKREGLEVKAVLNTHDHQDHTGADRYYAGIYQAPICGSRTEAKPQSPPPDRYLEDGETLEYPGIEVRVLLTPGHTPESLCFSIGDFLFSGDTLFKNDIGRVWTQDPDNMKKVQESLVENIKKKLLGLPGRTKVCPGHGKTSTIADELVNNPFLKK